MRFLLLILALSLFGCSEKASLDSSKKFNCPLKMLTNYKSKETVKDGNAGNVSFSLKSNFSFINKVIGDAGLEVNDTFHFNNSLKLFEESNSYDSLFVNTYNGAIGILCSIKEEIDDFKTSEERKKILYDKFDHKQDELFDFVMNFGKAIQDNSDLDEINKKDENFTRERRLDPDKYVLSINLDNSTKIEQFLENSINDKLQYKRTNGSNSSKRLSITISRDISPIPSSDRYFSYKNTQLAIHVNENLCLVIDDSDRVFKDVKGTIEKLKELEEEFALNTVEDNLNLIIDCLKQVK